MIDAIELRLNNLVRYENENFKIHSVSPELPCLYTIEFGIGVVTYKSIYPIELQEDILIKCGFEWKTKEGHREYGNSHFYMNYDSEYHRHFYLWANNGKYIFSYGKCSIEIKYLHQLQNLYYCLTGKELEITL